MIIKGMKKTIVKIISALLLVGGICIGALCHGVLAFLGAFILAYIGLLGLLKKEWIFYY